MNESGPQTTAPVPSSPPAGAVEPLARRADARRAAVEMVRTARRSLALLSAALDPEVFDHGAMLEALAALARRRGARLRILVREPRIVTARGHRMVELAQRLSTAFELRRPHPQHCDGTEQLLVVDERAVLFRPIELRSEGWACPDAPAEARRRLKAFDEQWDLATPDAELQRLYL